MSRTIEKEIRIFKHSAILALIVGIFSLWFFWYDVKYNPVIEFNNGVNPSEFKLDKKEYKRGEMVRGYTSFCKVRNSVASTRWTLYDGRIYFFTSSEPRSSPKGCYPSKDGEYVLFDIQRVPEDAPIGDTLYFAGINYQSLWGNRTAEQTFKTESFKIIE